MRIIAACLVGLSVVLSLTAPVSAQWSSDSLSRDERFWARTGGYARQMSLGAGGFGMLADSGITTLGVNPYSVDPLFAFQNPSYIQHYPGYLAFDVGAIGQSYLIALGQSFEGYFAMSKASTLGIVVARSDATNYTLFNPNIAQEISGQVPGSFNVVRPNTTWELMSAFDLGGSSLGVGVSYFSTSQGTSSPSTVDSTTALYKYSQLGVTAGTLIGMGGGMLDLGASLLLPSVTQTFNSGVQQTQSNEWSLMSLGVNARAFIPMKSEFYLVPIADLYLASGTTTKIGSPKDLPASLAIDFGVGVNFWASSVHIMSGVSVGSYRQVTPSIDTLSPQLTHSQLVAPRFNIGAEWPALKWLTVRLGYIASSVSESEEVKRSATERATIDNYRSNLYMPLFPFSNNGASATNTVLAGVGIKLDRLVIDAMVNNSLFHYGPGNVVTGGAPFGYVTLSYRFDS